MKTMLFLLAGVPALALSPVCQSQSKAGEPKTKSLVRVKEDPNASPRAPGEDEFDRTGWSAKLQSKDLDLREQAFASVIEEARRNDEARRALEAWSQDSGDLAWTSRLALRELGQRPGRGMRSSLRPDVDALQRQMEELHQRFGGMDSMFEDLQREMDEMLRGAPHSNAAPQGGGSWWESNAQGYTLQVGPDGVRAEVTENENGKLERKTYTAKTLDELYEAHPELKGRMRVQMAVPGAPGTEPFGAAPRTRGGQRSWWSAPQAGEDEDSPAPARPLVPSDDAQTPKLGINCQPITTELAPELFEKAGHGLLVDSVLPGSLAEHLGLRPGDVLLELNGTRIDAREDVAGVMKTRQVGDELRAQVLDKKGKTRNLSFVPKSAGTSGEGRRF